jgi:enamine deaminase RidA (YjgF/YER057c/UK114 family)
MSRRLVQSASPYEEKIAYSRAVIDGPWIFISGTTGADAHGVLSGDVTEQCREALRKIELALTEAGANFDDVVRVVYYLPDRADFEPCWPLLREAFATARPAATMLVAGLIDPAMKIEIEVTARKRSATL